MRSYYTSREDLITQAVQQIKALRVQCENDCERVRDAVRFDERRAQQHARLNAMKMIRVEKNVRVRVCLYVCVCECMRMRIYMYMCVCVYIYVFIYAYVSGFVVEYAYI